MAVTLLLATAQAAEKAPPLVGATRSQVLQRLGEPKSNIVAGNREILFFARERVVLRNGVVVEVEELPAESAPRRPAPAPASTDTPAAKDASSEPPATKGAPAATETSSAGATPSSATADATTSAASTVSSEPKLEIKSVRPPSSSGTRATPKASQPAATAPAPVSTPQRTAPPSSTDITTTKATTATPPASAPAPAAATVGIEPKAGAGTVDAPVTSHTTASDSAQVEPATSKAAETKAEPTAAATTEPKAKAKTARRTQRDVEVPSASEQIFTGRTYAIALVIIVGGFGYLFWRYRQRQLLLAATAVSRTPFNPAPAAGGGAVFTPDLIGKLEWKRFEELVCAYYSKTGVVAARTKSGPATAVNIRISWKGESRPFACVRCLAQTNGLIDAKPLQELHAVLAAEDIRRGYVVTTGKFSVPARDFAEEKHITLLPGDIFLEKLNALPDAARSEIMHEVTTGDYTTPSCPKCEAKMIRSPEDPSMWRCMAHPDQQIPVRK